MVVGRNSCTGVRNVSLMVFAELVTSVDPGRCCRYLVISACAVDKGVLPLSFLTSDTMQMVCTVLDDLLWS